MTRLAVFDCDGTLVDGQADICDTMEHAFTAAGLAAPDRNQVRRMVGLSLPVAVRYLVPDIDEAQIGTVVAAYKEGYFARRQSGTLEEPLYHGMRELLHSLHEKGWLLAVATGKSDRGLNACLTGHGIKDLFVSLQTADWHPSKPHPAMLEAAMMEAGASADQTIMIGDTSFDIDMARGAGVQSIGVAWGYHPPEELVEAGASGVAHSMADLEQRLESAL